jgi:hypothetical protein
MSVGRLAELRYGVSFLVHDEGVKHLGRPGKLVV